MKPLISQQELEEVLIQEGIIDSDSIENPVPYDNGATELAVSVAARRLNSIATDALRSFKCTQRPCENFDVPCLVRLGWKPVSFAADCDGYDEESGELGGICSICGLDYCDECQCPGPTQDGVEYANFGGVLYGRFIEENSTNHRTE